MILSRLSTHYHLVTSRHALEDMKKVVEDELVDFFCKTMKSSQSKENSYRNGSQGGNSGSNVCH